MNPVVLIPGMMCDARMWGSIPAALHPRRVINAIPDDADSIPALADAILRRSPPRFALAGLSMGGIVAMEIVARAPERVERLALLSTNPRAELPEMQARRQPQIDRALSGELASVMGDDMIPNYLAPHPDPAPILDLCMDMALTLGPQVFARQSRALRDRADRQAALASFTGPALVLAGTEDRLCPRDRHDLMHRLMPQSRLVMIPGTGHLPPLEKPQEPTAALHRWLED